MNNITTSLEQSKRLKEAGWDKETRLWWLIEDDYEYAIDSNAGYSWSEYPDWSADPKIAAPTAEEVLRELPLSVIGSGAESENHLVVSPRGNGKWDIYYEQANGMTKAHIIGDTIAGAAAEMWIYLKENDLLPTT